ncbi:MAG: M28 family peptidase [Candidatus Hydrogenedentes bacterium]|nr:M28 family peptidase [Candidatus Hydrogenedentota bacterium]
MYYPATISARAAGALLLSAIAFLPLPGRAEEPKPETQEARLLSQIRQYTFGGARSGEGYFSSDGARMVFQSEREEGNPFYQIYLLDRETGAVERVSTGDGKTTCAWIHPAGNRVLFASTHEDPEAQAKQEAELSDRASGVEKRYSWDYDEHYELYVRDLGSGALARLTDALGYDAEAAWDPRGEMIVFSSNRHAYAAPLSEEEEKIFEVDKSYFLDLYAMDSDGGNVRRLTEVPGYDGGPFFSADGEFICFRRFSKDGATAEIHTMRRDGSGERQLTRLGAMSWAPFFHPSGEYLIFATNIHGFGNFELYLVDAAGAKEPVRVTWTDGFDGLPVFTPDGAQIAWTSTRTPGKQSQIFLADWNHDDALRLLNGEEVLPASVEVRAFMALPEDHALEPAITAADIQHHVVRLASEEFEGRGTGTEGEILATQYVADFFAWLGLKPAGDDGTYFDEFEFTAGINLGPENALRVSGAAGPYTVDEDWRPLAFSSTGEIAEAGAVFAGYGIVAPASGDQPEYDSFVHLDVTDKWVVVFRFLPEDVTPERRQHLAQFASLRFKATNVRDRGGKGLIVVSGPTSQAREQLPPLTFDVSLGGTSVAVIAVTDAVARDLLASSGKDLEALQKELDGGEPQMGFALEGVELGATIALEKERRTGRNVLAVLEADDPQGGAVAIGAHVDHLGRGGSGSSLAEGAEPDAIHYGADDNASGVAGMLEIAARLAADRAAGAFQPKRDVLFAAWSGEEMGLLGSDHFAKELANGGDSIAEAVSSYLNLDMVGRLSGKLVVSGAGSSPTWYETVERANATVGLPIVMQADSYLPTDATSFYLKQVPIFSAFSGVHGEYHTPKDTPDLLNYPGAARISELVYRVASDLAQREDTPPYVAMERPDEEAGRGGMRAYLGTVPDYAESDVKGMVLNGVTRGAPADKAGLKAGDIIVEMAGKPIENIYDYTYAIQALKIGEEIGIVVERGGERVELKITPESRQ